MVTNIITEWRTIWNLKNLIYLFNYFCLYFMVTNKWISLNHRIEQSPFLSNDWTIMKKTLVAWWKKPYIPIWRCLWILMCKWSNQTRRGKIREIYLELWYRHVDDLWPLINAKNFTLKFVSDLALTNTSMNEFWKLNRSNVKRRARLSLSQL